MTGLRTNTTLRIQGEARPILTPDLLQKAWGSTDYSRPIVVGKSLYALRFGQGRPTSIASFNLLTGQQEWRTSLEVGTASELTYIEGMLVVGVDPANSSNPTKLHVLDASSGMHKYAVDLPQLRFPSAPAIARNSSNELVAYLRGSSNVASVTLGASGGSLLWTQSAPSISQSMPTLVGSSLIIEGTDRHYLYDQLTGAVNVFPGGNWKTVAFDSTRMQYYVRSFLGPLTAYSYTSNGVVSQNWQTSVGEATSVAIGADGAIFAADSSSIYKLDPDNGHVITSVTGLELSNSYTPVLTANSLFVYSNTATEVFDLNTLAHVKTLTPGAPNSNTPVRSPGAIFDRGYVLYRRPGFDVYFAVPEPSTATVITGVLALLTVRRRSAAFRSHGDCRFHLRERLRVGASSSRTPTTASECGTCAIRPVSRSSYSPMILTRTRFFRRPSNS
jgi:hypothetical protein